ncbi:hypothetical protein [Amycolatopsis suaedae]|uniref:Uncharacterized protein n=1 Tax=Amycolatopsis suaedae TaxID=2510978 RepID=A0A4Q7JCI2_9PSEU|nr:hypothetical protein [Amycolatopsis suaedae]RZQ64253.1 hypothetical protein EWH70_09740 [Amycolatopsis suaedae]
MVAVFGVLGGVIFWRIIQGSRPLVLTIDSNGLHVKGYESSWYAEWTEISKIAYGQRFLDRGLTKPLFVNEITIRFRSKEFFNRSIPLPGRISGLTYTAELHLTHPEIQRVRAYINALFDNTTDAERLEESEESSYEVLVTRRGQNMVVQHDRGRSKSVYIWGIAAAISFFGTPLISSLVGLPMLRSISALGFFGLMLGPLVIFLCISAGNKPGRPGRRSIFYTDVLILTNEGLVCCWAHTRTALGLDRENRKLGVTWEEIRAINISAPGTPDNIFDGHAIDLVPSHDDRFATRHPEMRVFRRDNAAYRLPLYVNERAVALIIQHTASFRPDLTTTKNS